MPTDLQDSFSIVNLEQSPPHRKCGMHTLTYNIFNTLWLTEAINQVFHHYVIH